LHNNKGFEVVINNRKYFAFSYFTQDDKSVTSYCDRTFTNSSHNIGVNPVNWSCFYGVKEQTFEEDAKKVQMITENAKFES
jgi:hypothetical protein